MQAFERTPLCRQPTVLLAEDDAGHARLIQRNLRESGIENPIQHFVDGAALLDFLFMKSKGSSGPDFRHAYVLLLDIRMPKVSGDEVLAQLKGHPRLRLLPVVMLTTTDDPREMRHCFELGCNEYITKPVDYDQFVSVIQKLGAFLSVACAPALEG